MPLILGTTLGPYAVTAKIGEGGMGEVWQARDTTLDRDVALKVLPEAFTSDPDRLARFRREAQVLASQSSEHRHPCAEVGLVKGRYWTVSCASDAALADAVRGSSVSMARRCAESPK